MKRLGAVPIALLWLSPSVCAAAELTRIVSSFEPNHPFGFSLEVGYQRTQDKSKILRENYQGGGLAEVAEMNYLLVDQRMVIDARIGLWEDLEFKYVLPVVFAQDRSWRYAGGVSNANSTVTNNCLRANGELVDVNCVSTGEGRQRIFDPNSDSFRSGLGDMTFGLAYAIFNQERTTPSRGGLSASTTPLPPLLSSIRASNRWPRGRPRSARIRGSLPPQHGWQ